MAEEVAEGGYVPLTALMGVREYAATVDTTAFDGGPVKQVDVIGSPNEWFMGLKRFDNDQIDLLRHACYNLNIGVVGKVTIHSTVYTVVETPSGLYTVEKRDPDTEPDSEHTKVFEDGGLLSDEAPSIAFHFIPFTLIPR